MLGTRTVVLSPVMLWVLSSVGFVVAQVVPPSSGRVPVRPVVIQQNPSDAPSITAEPANPGLLRESPSTGQLGLSAGQMYLGDQPIQTAGTAANGAVYYLWDDGAAENSVGVGNGVTGNTFGWANQFANTTGSDVVLTEIEVAFGTPAGATGVTVGDAIDGLIWVDESASGNMVNATLTVRWPLFGGVHANDGTTFASHTIPGGGVTIPAGAEFYVGLGDIQTEIDSTIRYPAALDQTTSAGMSWAFFAPSGNIFDPNNLPAQTIDIVDNFGLPGNFLIRASTQGTPARGWGENDSGGHAANFILGTPETVFEGGLTGATAFLGAGDFGPEGTFEVMYVLNTSLTAQQNLYTMSTVDGNLTVIGPASPEAGETWAGMAWDSTTGTMYASASNCGSSSTLYTIDLGTGAATWVGSMVNSPCAIALAAAPDGTLYSYDVINDDFGEVNKITGFYTAIGSIGFDANFGQGMDFNDSDSTLYMAALNSLNTHAELRTVDLTTGATTLVGTIGSTRPGLGATQFGFLGIDPGSFIPAPDPLVGTAETAKTNRYLRFSAPAPVVAADAPEVIRVRVVAMEGFAVPSPDVFYIGPPFAASEENSSLPNLTFVAAPFQCGPFEHTWATEGIISAYGAEIMPGSTYEVQRTSGNCPNFAINETCWSTPLTITTARFADAVEPFFTNPGDLQPDFKDISAAVQKFLGSPTAPIKAFIQMQPNVVFPDRAISFKDINAFVQSFLGTLYADISYATGPCTCPSAVTCGTSACATDGDCGAGLCISGFCTDACGRCTP